MNLNKPIPLDRHVDGWKAVEIQECNDPMVLLNDYSQARIKLLPEYHRQNIPGAITSMYCREELATRLLKAANELPGGHRFLIWDAWRPVNVQTALFDAYRSKLKAQTGLDGNELEDLVQSYVSLPSTDEKKPSPHLTGGAIDLTLIDKNGRELDMGTDFDYFGPEASTDYYEQKKNLSENEKVIKKNRRFLFNLLTAFGFTNYPHEWWHYDYGNQFWGIQVNQKAIYNKILKPW